VARELFRQQVDGVTADTHVGEAAALVFAARMAAIRLTLPLAARDAEQDIEHVHRLRVATRRMAAALGVFEPIVGMKQHRKSMKMLKAIRKAAGDARACDVHILEFARRHHTSDAREQRSLEELIAYLTRRRAKAQARIRAASNDYPAKRIERRENKLIGSIRSDGPLSDQTLDALAADFVPSLIDSLHEHGRELIEIEQLHELRIAGKQVRYALAVLAPCYECTADAAKQFQQLQDALGNINDIHETVLMLRRYRAQVKKDKHTGVAARGLSKANRVKALKKLRKSYEQDLSRECEQFIAKWERGTWTQCLEDLAMRGSGTMPGVTTNGQPSARQESSRLSEPEASTQDESQ